MAIKAISMQIIMQFKWKVLSFQTSAAYAYNVSFTYILSYRDKWSSGGLFWLAVEEAFFSSLMWQLSCTKYVVARKGEEVYSILQLLVSFTKLLTFEVRCCWLQYFRKFIINFESYVYQSRSWGTRNFSFPICNVLSPVSLS